MAGGNREHHGHRAHDQDKGHQTDEYQRQARMRKTREGLEGLVGVGPAVRGKPVGAIRDQKCTEREGVAHQEIPHHQLPVLHVEGALSTTPPFLSRWYYMCHVVTLLNFQIYLIAEKNMNK